jgi:hypothetical protein
MSHCRPHLSIQFSTPLPPLPHALTPLIPLPRNLVYAPSWFTEVREKIVSNPEWFIKFKANPPYNNTKCTFGKCSDLFHSQFQTPEYHSGSVDFGSCDEHCDCGDDIPCGWYLWNHSHADCREWLVQEHMMGNMSMGNDNVQVRWLVLVRRVNDAV